MRTLYPIIAFALAMALASEATSKYEFDPMGGKVYIYREKIFYTIMTLGMAVFVGLRTRGNDTYAYRIAFEQIDLNGSIFSGIDWTNLSAAPGLQLLERLLKSWGATAQDYFMVCAVITITIYLWFIHKYTSDIWLSVYYFITMGVYTFAMAAIKQTMCVALLLLATDCAIQKKWFRLLFWYAIAQLFHPYAFVYLIIPFLSFRPWSYKTNVLLVGTAIASLLLSRLMGNIMTLTEVLGADYSEAEFIGEGVNIFRVMVVWVPVIISFLGKKYYEDNDDRATNIIINATMINALIMFIGLFGTANYFARLANYFLIFQTLALPWVMRVFEVRSKKLVIKMSLLCFALYFYYQCVLAQGSFDQAYNFLSFGKFIRREF